VRKLKYYEELVAMGCFMKNELVNLTGSEAAAASLVYSYLRKGYIERVRRDLYATISIETKQPICNRFQIAAQLADDACLSYHSAFEYYGYANQVYYDVYVSSKRRFREFSYNSITYHRVSQASETIQTVVINKVTVTSPEQTVVDSINNFEQIGGLEEVLRCILLVPFLSAEKLLSALTSYHSGFLYQKVGYLLEALNNTLGLPESFFEECKKYLSNSKKYLSSEHKGYVLHDSWLLFAPKSINELLDKGVTDYDAI
jgi:predicted transcriptional regulator of viral defense system